MKLALCSDNPSFSKDQLQNTAWSTRFPGSGWVSLLYAQAEKEGFELASGDIALEKINLGIWQANEVNVVSEMDSKDAKKLLALGAKPLLINCFEAPLYAPLFYDNVKSLSSQYRYQWIFSPDTAEMNCAHLTDSVALKFPAYFQSDMRSIVGWENRKYITYIAENKYRSPCLYVPASLKPVDFMRQVKYWLMRKISYSYRDAIKNVLHDERLMAIEYFMKHYQLDLYGSGWNNLGNLPIHWSRRLLKLTKSRYFGRCENKLDTLSQYRFALCFENMRSPGYMTEKIIDCFVAGAIPIYLGDPNIQDYVPESAYIDFRKYAGLGELGDYLQSINQEQAKAMIEAGRNYLSSEAGTMHSYEGFAKNFVELARK